MHLTQQVLHPRHRKVKMRGKACLANAMKAHILLAWCAAISFAGAQTSRLSEQEREALLKRLHELREVSDSRVEARYRTASSAYHTAMASDEATLALYLKCVEKVDFTDQKRRASDFRDWRRNNDEHLKDGAFRRALRYQLRWLVLSLQASSESADRAVLASGAHDIVESIVNDAANLTGQQNILNQSVAGSIFARAYDIGDIETKDWVLSPGRVGQIYEQIILPQYRTVQRTDSLRAAWIKRIQQEIRLIEEWSTGGDDRRGRIGMASAQVRPEVEKFKTEEVPRLQWQMEVDLFKHGDPAGAASRMLAHLDRHVAHASARDWAASLEDLLTPEVSLSGNPQRSEPETTQQSALENATEE